MTASRLSSMMRCPRSHFWRYEIGLSPTTEAAVALRFGSAWARGTEARWKKATYDEALVAAIPEGVALDPYAIATVAALLAAYYDYYGERETFGEVFPESQFGPTPIGDGFSAMGKLDALGSLTDGRSGIIESKTTKDSLAPDSEYWMRLRFNMQVWQYITAAREAGWDVSVLLYDVCRKPQISPCKVYNLDEQGRKIVTDKNGKRVFKQKKVALPFKGRGKKPKGWKPEIVLVDDTERPMQSGNEAEGYILKSHIETPDEFSDRLYKDAIARPDFYFARREIPIIDQELESFANQRRAICRIILACRENEVIPYSSNPDVDPDETPRDPEAWPRNISRDTCNFCSFKSFCLQNISVNPNNPPAGFKVTPFNPELEQNETTNEETTDENDNATAAD